jgi:uncharacterized membrane protein YgdD (TMEM256/DUF423 family)
MQNKFIVFGALFMALGVTAGAFGAHILKDKLSLYELSIYEKAVHYQMIHALGLIFIGLYSMQNSDKKIKWAGNFLVIGIILFSGSLYLLSVRNISFTGNISAILGPMTPIGGLSFVFGWILLFWSALTFKQENKHAK